MDRPIIFSAPMVRAILSGAKSQTRRIVKPQPFGGDRIEPAYSREDGFIVGQLRDSENAWRRIVCPYGNVGDRLWVREAWRTVAAMDADRPTRIAEQCLDAGYRKPWAPIQYEADRQRDNWNTMQPAEPGKLRSPRHMPRWASRLTLEITAVRAQQLHDISEADAIAEGVRSISLADVPRNAAWSERQDFAHLWDKINGAGAWDANPWVWAITFRRYQP